jgi:hypothetical protein
MVGRVHGISKPEPALPICMKVSMFVVFNLPLAITWRVGILSDGLIKMIGTRKRSCTLETIHC